MWDSIKGYVGPTLMGLAALGVLSVLALVFLKMFKLFTDVKIESVGSLALLAIGGVVVLIMMLTAVAMIFSVLKITNGSQAMGLPEGSIRAVIALSLIVLFAILSVFLYKGVSTGGAVSEIKELSDAGRTQLVQTLLQNPSIARDIQSTITTAPGVAPPLYKVTYRTPNPTGDDFAKQLLVLLGTLMTAVTSFYLGAGTATSVAKEVKALTEQAASSQRNPSPEISTITPKSHSIANEGATIKMEISGSNLDAAKSVKIVRGPHSIPGSLVSTSATRLVCNIPVDHTTAPPGAAWDVVVDDGSSKPITKQGWLTIT